MVVVNPVGPHHFSKCPGAVHARRGPAVDGDGDRHGRQEGSGRAGAAQLLQHDGRLGQPDTGTARCLRDGETHEAELAEVLKLAIARIDKASHLGVHQRRDWKRALREAQRHWLAYRNSELLKEMMAGYDRATGGSRAAGTGAGGREVHTHLHG